MYVTCKGLTHAAVSSGGDGSAMAYTGGVVEENLLAKAEVTFQYAEGSDYADGKRIAHKHKMTGVGASVELADLPASVKKAMLGWVSAGANSNDLQIGKEAGAIGFGFYIWNEEPVSEDDQWICYWIYKIKFRAESVSVSTSNDSIAYQHQTINGVGDGVQLSSGGDIYFAITNEDPLETEAEAVAWLKAKAGIS